MTIIPRAEPFESFPYSRVIRISAINSLFRRCRFPAAVTKFADDDDFSRTLIGPSIRFLFIIVTKSFNLPLEYPSICGGLYLAITIFSQELCIYKGVAYPHLAHPHLFTQFCGLIMFGLFAQGLRLHL